MVRILGVTGVFAAAVAVALLGSQPTTADDKPAPKGGHTGVALALGLNSVDPAHYAGWSGDLNACENDANDMAGIATSKGFKTTTLFTRQATRQAVIDHITKAAADLKAGDIFMLSYSGHGGQVPDQNGDEEDGLDETWCLYDGQMIDDELAALWPKFAAGVRVLVLSDICHSGTVTKFREYEQLYQLNAASPADAHLLKTGFDELLAPPARPRERPVASPVRAMPLKVVNATFQKNRAFYEKLGKGVANQKESEKSTNCTVLLISGCQDNQLSADGPMNGLFTAKLRYVWDSGRFSGDYRDFHKAIVRNMPSYQSPNYYVVGAANPQFERQAPFAR